MLVLYTSPVCPSIPVCKYDGKHWELLSCVVIGASLSEPHTSVTAFAEVVYMSACLLACLLVAIYHKF